MSFLFFFSCKVTITKNNNDEKYVAFPPKPDTARIQFLTSISSSKDLEKRKRTSFEEFVVGKKKDEIKLIQTPLGVNVKHGKIYVCDAFIQGIDIIDLKSKRTQYFIPSGKKKLLIPVNTCLDRNHYLYIADAGRKEILVFDHELKYVTSFGKPEDFTPQDVIVLEDKIYVANIEGRKIDVFKNDSTYKLLYSFPEVERGDEGFLYQPKNIAYRNGKIYVSDFGSFDVKIFKEDGEYISTFGKQGLTPGTFARPKGIAVDRDENIYVLDASFNNAQIFNKKNQLLFYFGNSTKSGKGCMYLPIQIFIDYENFQYFKHFVDPDYELKYLIFVTNQYGENKVSIYGRVEIKK